MKRLLYGLAVAALSSALGFAQQGSSASDQNQANASSGQSSATASSQSGTQNSSAGAAQEQSNPAGGSPSSAVPGRVTGADPTQVQQELNKQLPSGDQVTASVADDGSLKLTGTVRSDAEKAKAEEIAQKASNRNINDQIQVKSGKDSSQSSGPK